VEDFIQRQTPILAFAFFYLGTQKYGNIKQKEMNENETPVW
jgi:hypothetical protein